MKTVNRKTSTKHREEQSSPMFMKSGQVMQMLQISRGTLERYVHELGMPYYTIGPSGDRRYLPAEVLSWAKKFRKGKR